ncbi:MAG TPA: DoxX family protein [Firmicutes bacterium]|nr:DoxX family protein [Bacillota bacterium]
MSTFKRALLLLIRLYVGSQWLEAGWEKLHSPVWVGEKAGVAINGFFQGALAKATGEHPAVQSWYAWFLKEIAIPSSGFFTYLIPIGETLVGLALILGAFTTFAAVMGAFMNLNFMLAGTTSTNPILYTLEIVIIAAGATAGAYGLDHFLLPYVRPYWQRFLQALRLSGSGGLAGIAKARETARQAGR